MRSVWLERVRRTLVLGCPVVAPLGWPVRGDPGARGRAAGDSHAQPVAVPPSSQGNLGRGRGSGAMSGAAGWCQCGGGPQAWLPVTASAPRAAAGARRRSRAWRPLTRGTQGLTRCRAARRAAAAQRVLRRRLGHSQPFVVSQHKGRWGRAEKVPGLAALRAVRVPASTWCRAARRAAAAPPGLTPTAPATLSRSWSASTRAGGAARRRSRAWRPSARSIVSDRLGVVRLGGQLH